MTDSIMYHEGNRRLQDQFESRRISDRLETFTRTQFTPDDRAFIESMPYFFLATADAEGRPDCSFKGGMPGFVAITGPSELAFPDYDGNGMFKSLGNILVNVEVGMLFIAMHGKPQRLRVNGTATVSHEDPLLSERSARSLSSVSPRKRSFRIVRATSRPCSWSMLRSTRHDRAAIRLSPRGRSSPTLKTACTRANRPSRADGSSGSGRRPVVDIPWH